MLLRRSRISCHAVSFNEKRAAPVGIDLRTDTVLAARCSPFLENAGEAFNATMCARLSPVNGVQRVEEAIWIFCMAAKSGAFVPIANR